MKPDEASTKSRIATLAAGISEGSVGLLEGIRNMAPLIRRLERKNEAYFLPILAIESETEDVPTGEARKLWEPLALRRKEAEVEVYLEKVREVVLDSCKKIREELGN